MTNIDKIIIFFFSPLSQSISKLVKECDYSLKRKKKYFAFIIINKIPYILTFLYGIDSEKETKKLETNYFQTDYWQENFLPLKNNFDIGVNGTEFI